MFLQIHLGKEFGSQWSGSDHKTEPFSLPISSTSSPFAPQKTNYVEKHILGHPQPALIFAARVLWCFVDFAQVVWWLCAVLGPSGVWWRLQRSWGSIESCTADAWRNPCNINHKPFGASLAKKRQPKLFLSHGKIYGALHPRRMVFFGSWKSAPHNFWIGRSKMRRSGHPSFRFRIQSTWYAFAAVLADGPSGILEGGWNLNILFLNIALNRHGKEAIPSCSKFHLKQHMLEKRIPVGYSRSFWESFSDWFLVHVFDQTTLPWFVCPQYFIWEFGLSAPRGHEKKNLQQLAFVWHHFQSVESRFLPSTFRIFLGGDAVVTCCSRFLVTSPWHPLRTSGHMGRSGIWWWLLCSWRSATHVVDQVLRPEFGWRKTWRWKMANVQIETGLGQRQEDSYM